MPRRTSHGLASAPEPVAWPASRVDPEQAIRRLPGVWPATRVSQGTTHERQHGDEAAVVEEADRRQLAEERARARRRHSRRRWRELPVPRRLRRAWPLPKPAPPRRSRTSRAARTRASSQKSGRQPTSGTSHAPAAWRRPARASPIISIQELLRSCSRGIEPAAVAGQRRHEAGADAHAGTARAPPAAAEKLRGQREQQAAGDRDRAGSTGSRAWGRGGRASLPSGNCVSAKPRK